MQIYFRTNLSPVFLIVFYVCFTSNPTLLVSSMALLLLFLLSSATMWNNSPHTPNCVMSARLMYFLSPHFSFPCALVLQVPGSLFISVQCWTMLFSSGVPGPLSTAGMWIRMENAHGDMHHHFSEWNCWAGAVTLSLDQSWIYADDIFIFLELPILFMLSCLFHWVIPFAVPDSFEWWRNLEGLAMERKWFPN